MISHELSPELPLIDHCSSTLSQMMANRKHTSIEKGKFLYLEGQLINTLYQIEHGYVKLGRYDTNGNEIIIAILNRNDWLGALTLEEAPQREFAQTLSEVKFKQLTQANHLPDKNIRDLYPQLLEEIDGRLQMLEAKQVIDKIRNTYHRLQHFLKFAATYYGKLIDDIYYLPHILSQNELGSIITCSRQTVSRGLNQLKRDEKIDFDRSQIKLYPKFFSQLS